VVAQGSQYYIKKKPSQKITGGVTQVVDPEFKPQCHKKIKKFSRKVCFEPGTSGSHL
jgi:hypothetical protein